MLLNFIFLSRLLTSYFVLTSLRKKNLNYYLNRKNKRGAVILTDAERLLVNRYYLKKQVQQGP